MNKPGRPSDRDMRVYHKVKEWRQRIGYDQWEGHPPIFFGDCICRYALNEVEGGVQMLPVITRLEIDRAKTLDFLLRGRPRDFAFPELDEILTFPLAQTPTSSGGHDE